MFGEVAKWSNAFGLGPNPSGSRVRSPPSSHNDDDDDILSLFVLCVTPRSRVRSPHRAF